MTKIAVVEHGVHVEGKEQVIFWEPLSDLGMVAREQDVFEDFRSPIPQTTKEAVEDTSTHDFDEETQVYSVGFMGSQLVYCPIENRPLGLSPLARRQAFLDMMLEDSHTNRMLNRPEYERRMEFEGGWDIGTEESKTVVSEIRVSTINWHDEYLAPIHPIEAPEVTERIQNNLQAIIARSMGVPTYYLATPSGSQFFQRSIRGMRDPVDYEVDYDRSPFRSRVYCIPSRELGGFYADRISQDEIANLGLSIDRTV